VSFARAPKSEEYGEQRAWYDECRNGNETTMNECYSIREIIMISRERFYRMPCGGANVFFRV
jgi:hypothetical protein